MVKVSVVIPVYNVEDYLNECLDSIINQTLKDIEIICINDGSTDGSLKILEEYAKADDRIMIHSQQNGGLSASRNQGIHLAQGEYVYFIDSDDYLDLTAMDSLYTFSNDNDLDILIFKMINFNDGTSETYTSNYYEMSFLNDFEGKIFDFNEIGKDALRIAVSIPGKFFKRELIENMRFLEGLIFEDNLFFTEAMLKAKRISLMNKHFYYRRIRENSITTSKTIKFADNLIIFNKIIDLFKEYGIYEKYKKQLIEKKITTAYTRFSQVDEIYKAEFFNRIKKDFKKHEDEYEHDDVFLNKINNKERFIFRSALSSNSYEEFESNVEGYKSPRNKSKKKNIKKNSKNASPKSTSIFRRVLKKFKK